jgi:hypothetical protein
MRWRGGGLIGGSLGVLMASALAAGSAPAQDAAASLQPICTDRPTKADGTCTVDPGHFQIEADIVNASFQRADGVTSDQWLVFNPTLKYGLAPNLDISLQYQFLNTPGVQMAVIPFVTAPTARTSLGDGGWAGGATVPINIKLSSTLNLTLQPELGVLENDAGNGQHLANSEDVSLALSLPRQVTLFAELWGQWDFDPTGTQRQYSADIAASLGIGRDSQLDAGVNFGLNRSTPGVNPYIGVSHRF